ncbi:hypothetical protein RQP46_009779 [Phenoliferia psychrophenolica]
MSSKLALDASPDAHPPTVRKGWLHLLRRTRSFPVLPTPDDDESEPVSILFIDKTPPMPSIPFDLIESPQQRDERRKWAKAKGRIYSFMIEALDDPGDEDEWALRVVRDGGDTGPTVLEMTPLAARRLLLPPKGADGMRLDKGGGTWLLRECTASPLGSITKSAWRVNGMRGFPHSVFVEFRKKEKKARPSPRLEDEKENGGLAAEGGGWFRRRTESTMSTAKSERSAKGD